MHLDSRPHAFRRGDELLHGLTEIETGFERAQLLGRGARLGPRAGEEGAAVLGGERRHGEGPDLLGLLDDLGLVPGDQRPQQRQVGRLLDDAQVVERLRGDLAERVPRDQHLGSFSPPEHRGHLHHQTALREHLQPIRAGRRDATLDDAEGHEKEPRPALEAVELRGVRVRLVDRLRARVRAPAEVDEVAAQASLHRPVRCHRRVDPAREQDESAPADADRQASAPGDLLRVGEDLALVDLEEDLEVGIRQVDAEPESVLDSSADDRGELPRVEREALVAAPRPDRERRSGPVAKQIDGCGARGLGRLLEHERRVEQRDAEHVAGALDQLVGGGRGEHGERSSSLPQLERAEIAEQPDGVPAQLRVEERPVSPLEHDLAELDQHAGLHARNCRRS